MEKIINIEPDNYSKCAADLLACNFVYTESSWDSICEEECRNCSVLIIRLNRFIGGKELDMFPSLKYIISSTTGTNHIDLNELEQRNIKLLCLKPYKDFLKTITSTPELTWALLLNVVRNIIPAVNNVKDGFWDRDKFKGYELSGKTMGIVGLGRIGERVAEYATAFGMNVIYTDISVDSRKYQKVDLALLFEMSDIVSIHVHLNEDTVHLIDRNVLSLLKPGSFLVNTSRGEILNETDVAKAMLSNKLSGVAVDVLSTELIDIGKSPLYQLMQKGYNVVITPHIGGATLDAMHKCELFMADQLIEIIKKSDE